MSERDLDAEMWNALERKAFGRDIAEGKHTEQAEQQTVPLRQNIATFLALIEQALEWFDNYIVDMEGEDDEDALTDAWNHWQKTIGEGEVWKRMIEEAEKWKHEAKCAIKERDDKEYI